MDPLIKELSSGGQSPSPTIEHRRRQLFDLLTFTEISVIHSPSSSNLTSRLVAVPKLCLRMLTDLSIKSSKPPERGQKTYWDRDGLGVRVSTGGSKTFVLMHGWPRRQRLTIGKYPTISLAMARDAAKTFLAKKQLGRHASPTLPFPDAVQLFLDQQTHLKPSTKRDYERILKKRFEPELKRYLLSEVQTHHVTAVLDDLLRLPAERKYCFSVIRRFFRWARGRRLVAQSPDRRT